jgi:hypothetical protein
MFQIIHINQFQIIYNLHHIKQLLNLHQQLISKIINNIKIQTLLIIYNNNNKHLHLINKF